MSIRMTIDVPDELGLDETDLKWRLAAKLFDEGLISSGQAADIVGVTKREFVLGVGRYQVSVFQYGIEEIVTESERRGTP